MQNKIYSVGNYKKNLNALIDESEDGRTYQNSPWWRNHFGKLYIRTGSFKLSDPRFISGIVKVQYDDIAALTFWENLACIKLLNSEVEVKIKSLHK